MNQIDHEESENRGPETLGSILRAPGHPKKGKNFKVIISLIGINQIDHEESENRGPETIGSILKAQWLMHL